MTELEMLQLAAKAVGLHYDPTRRMKKGLMVVRPGARGQGDQVLWDPANDDGDSRRLQVALSMDVHVVLSEEITNAYVPGAVQGYVVDHCEGGPEAATRLAVLVAAAEAGKALP